jgi:hypothetical protein
MVLYNQCFNALMTHSRWRAAGIFKLQNTHQAYDSPLRPSIILLIHYRDNGQLPYRIASENILLRLHRWRAHRLCAVSGISLDTRSGRSHPLPNGVLDECIADATLLKHARGHAKPTPRISSLPIASCMPGEDIANVEP